MRVPGEGLLGINVVFLDLGGGDSVCSPRENSSSSIFNICAVFYMCTGLPLRVKKNQPF